MLSGSQKARLAVFFYKPRRYWWAFWSWLYRLLFQRDEYQHLALPHYADPEMLQDVFDRVEWTGDGVREMGDACGMPEFFYHCYKQLITEGAQPSDARIDCDDFAVFGIATLSERFSAEMLCVTWLNQVEDSVEGHAVLMGRYPRDYGAKAGKYFHQGNWGLFGPFNSPGEVIDDIARRGLGREPLAWAFLKRNLSPRRIGYGRLVESA